MKKIKAERIRGWVYIPGERCEATLTFHGVDWALCLSDLDQAVRNKLKYGDEFKDADEALRWVREEIQGILEARNLTLDMIE